MQAAPRLAAAAVLALTLAACDDSGVAGAGGDCRPARETRSADGLAEGEARVRVNLVSRLGVEVGSGEGLRTSGVELYQGSRCVLAGGAALTRLGTVENSMGGAVADVVVDAGRITHVMLRQQAPEQGARRVRQEKIALDQPVTVEAGTRTEIFLALDSIAGSQDAAVRFVAAGPVQYDAGTVLVFEPGRAASAWTGAGFTLDMAGTSVSQPTVYGIQEHGVGGMSSVYDIMPRGRLAAAARISFPINRSRMAQGLSMDDYGVTMGGASLASTVSGGTVSFEASDLGSASMGTDRLWYQTADGSLHATPAGTASAAPGGTASLVNNVCSQRLAANRATYLSQLRTQAGVRVSDCEGVAPYVHILLINIAAPADAGRVRPRVLLPGEWYTNTNTFLLHTITEQANLVGAFAAVNGFQWDGDTGFSDGSEGVPRGSLYINGTRKSPAFSGAEAVIGFASQSSNATQARLFDKPSGTALSLGSYSWNAVPSTTSIVKNSVCSRSPGGTADRYSSMGIGGGVLVLASSTSSSSTTPYELCSVYEGLSMMEGAILLDGSTATGMYWLGTHINPITGANSYAYGSARHIAYAVAAVK